MEKLKKLKRILKSMGSLLVAYSGGLDSTFLLKVARDVLSDKAMAVTAVSPTYPKTELEFSKKMARALGVRHKVIRTDELKSRAFARNPINRCYYCKKELFGKLKIMAAEQGFNFVADASNTSDNKDFRPGSKAKQESGVRSPLQEAGISKEDIRRLSKYLKLGTWNKPSQACLASRIPYGTKITPEVLARIDKAETYIRKLGFKQVRVRHYNGLCRIEVEKNDIPALISKRKRMARKFKQLDYSFVTVDLEGYRTGSMNFSPSRRCVL